MTFAMALIFMVLWLIWALQSNGIWGFILHIFGPKGDSQGAMKYVMIVVFFAVGLIEVMSIAFRPISLSFRLFGNIFAGENLLDAMSHADPASGLGQGGVQRRCCRFRFISWNCWSALSRPSCSCC